MPCEQYLLTENIVVLAHGEDYTFEDVLESIRLAPKKANSLPVHILFDVRKSKSPRSLEEFNTIALTIFNADRLEKRVAVVQDMDDKLYYGMTRQFKAISENVGLEVDFFGEIEDAVNYLKSSQTLDNI